MPGACPSSGPGVTRMRRGIEGQPWSLVPVQSVFLLPRLGVRINSSELAWRAIVNKRISLPKPVAQIYEAVAQLEAEFPGRKFTPDGHLVGSIGEVVAAKALGLTLYPASYFGHDAFDENGDVQIKMTGKTGKNIALYATCRRLVVLKIVSSHEAEIVYDGPGEPVWSASGKVAKNGQRVVSLARLRMIAARIE